MLAKLRSLAFRVQRKKKDCSERIDRCSVWIPVYSQAFADATVSDALAEEQVQELLPTAVKYVAALIEMYVAQGATIPGYNQPPTAGCLMASGNQSATEGQILNLTVPIGGTANVSFAAGRSSDPDGTIVGWEWRLNGILVSTAQSLAVAWVLAPTPPAWWSPIMEVQSQRQRKRRS